MTNIIVLFSESAGSGLLKNKFREEPPSNFFYLTEEYIYYKNNQYLNLWDKWEMEIDIKIMCALECNFKNYVISRYNPRKNGKEFSENEKIEFFVASAYTGGNIELLNLVCPASVYEKPEFSEYKILYWNTALEGACEGGHIDLVNLAIHNGATALSRGAERAAAGGHVKVFHFITNLSEPDDFKYSYQHYLCEAAINGNIDMIEYLQDKFYPVWIDLFRTLCCLPQCFSTIHYLINKGHKYWNFGLDGACQGNCLAIALLMIKNGANDWRTGLETAILWNSKELIELMNSMIEKEVLQ